MSCMVLKKESVQKLKSEETKICNKCGVKFIAADGLLVCPECIREINRNNDYDLEPTMEMLKDGEGVTW